MPDNGWGFPTGATKAHAFVDGSSLCRRWGQHGFGGSVPIEAPLDAKPSDSDCAPCTRKVVALNA